MFAECDMEPVVTTSMLSISMVSSPSAQLCREKRAQIQLCKEEARNPKEGYQIQNRKNKALRQISAKDPSGHHMHPLWSATMLTSYGKGVVYRLEEKIFRYLLVPQRKWQVQHVAPWFFWRSIVRQFDAWNYFLQEIQRLCWYIILVFMLWFERIAFEHTVNLVVWIDVFPFRSPFSFRNI